MSDHEMNSEIISRLKQQRDELAVQVKLGQAEAQQEWEKVTAKLDALLQQYEPVTSAMSESTENVLSAVKLLANEVVDGFGRVRKAL